MKKRLLRLSVLLLVLLYACKRKSPPPAAASETDYLKALTFMYKQNDSAFYYLNNVIARSKDSLYVAMAYNNMAVIQSDAGDYFGSQESLLLSLKYLNEHSPRDRSCLSSDYNELGTTLINLRNYKEAIRYYDLAAGIADSRKARLIILNNKALVWQKEGAYDAALKLYQTIVAGLPKNTTSYARALSNYAKTRWLQQPGRNVAPQLLTALRIRLHEKDNWGQNSSYSHLADYYAHKRPDSALYFARHMYETAIRILSPDDRLEALQKLIKLSPPAQARAYFETYEHLNDSLVAVRSAAKNQYALIRYDALKNKTDNLRLQEENSEKKLQLSRQRFLLWGFLLLILSGTCLAILWYRKREQRLEWQAQSAIQEHRLQTSKKVHDVVANGLYRVMTEIDNQPNIDKEQLLDKIEVLYEQSRDISYEPFMQPATEFHSTIAELLASFATPNTKVLMVGNNSGLWTDAGERVKTELKSVLQELMVNMKKHSRATMVTVRFEQQPESVVITYTDNGTGFTDKVRYGNGLRNTGNRIRDIQGTITFDSDTATGLQVKIAIPIA